MIEFVRMERQRLGQIPHLVSNITQCVVGPIIGFAAAVIKIFRETGALFSVKRAVFEWHIHCFHYLLFLFTSRVDKGATMRIYEPQEGQWVSIMSLPNATRVRPRLL